MSRISIALAATGMVIHLAASVALLFRWSAVRKRLFFIADLALTQALFVTAAVLSFGVVIAVAAAIIFALVSLSGFRSLRFCDACGATVRRAPRFGSEVVTCQVCGSMLDRAGHIVSGANVAERGGLS